MAYVQMPDGSFRLVQQQHRITQQPAQTTTQSAEAERCQNKFKFSSLDNIDELLKLDIPGDAKSDAKDFKQKRIKYNNKCSNIKTERRRRKCTKINEARTKYGYNLMNKLSRYYKEKIKTRINKAASKPKEKRLIKLSCAISELLEMFKNNYCRSDNTHIKDIPTFISKFVQYMQTNHKSDYSESVKDLIGNILYNRGNVRDKQKQLMQLNPKAMNHLITFIDTIKECAASS